MPPSAGLSSHCANMPCNPVIARPVRKLAVAIRIPPLPPSAGLSSHCANMPCNPVIARPVRKLAVAIRIPPVAALGGTFLSLRQQLRVVPAAFRSRRSRQAGHFLSATSLHPPPAALRWQTTGMFAAGAPFAVARDPRNSFQVPHLFKTKRHPVGVSFRFGARGGT